ncbi:MAG TPA: DUF4191 domain-containing protein [Nocardioidaceae bacterium]|jgi:hypothetical protein
MARKDKGEKKQSSISKLIQAYKMTRQRDKRVTLVCLLWFLGVGLVFGALFWYFLHPVAGVIVGVATGLLAAMVVFGRRAERAAYAQLEGQPGAAAAALGVLKRGWHVQPAVSVTKNQDLVHRVVGRPGVILVGEGNPQRVRNLLGVEKKKHARVVGEVPIYDIVAGDTGEDAVPIKRLSKHIMKLPRNIRPADVTDLLQRLKALDAMRPQMPLPKGPMPTTARQAKQAARQSMRGR